MKLVPDVFLQFEQLEGYEYIEKFLYTLYDDMYMQCNIIHKEKKNVIVKKLKSDDDLLRLMEKKVLSITGVFICFVLNLGKKLQMLDIIDGKNKLTNIELNHNPHVFSTLINMFGYWSERNKIEKNYSKENVKYFMHFEFLNQVAHVLINFPDEYFRFLYKFKPFQRIVKYFHILPITMQELIIQIFRVYVFFFKPNDSTEKELSSITKSFLSLIKDTEHLKSVNKVTLFLISICRDDKSGNVKKLFNVSLFNRIIIHAFELHSNEGIRKNLLRLLHSYLSGSMKNMKSFLSRKKTLNMYNILKNEHNLITDTLNVLVLIVIQDKKQRWTTVQDLLKLLYSRSLSLYLQKSIILSLAQMFEKNSKATVRFREAKGFECLVEVLRKISFLISKEIIIFDIVQSVVWVLTRLVKTNQKNLKYFRSLDFEKIYHPLNKLGFIRDEKLGTALTMNLFQFAFMTMDLFDPRKKPSKLQFMDNMKYDIYLLDNAEIISEIIMKLYGENFEHIDDSLKKFFFTTLRIVTLKTMANRKRLCRVGGLKSLLTRFKPLFTNGSHTFHQIVLEQYLILSKYSTNVLETQMYFSFLRNEKFPVGLLDCLIDLSKIERVANNSIYFPPDSEKKSRILLPKLLYKNWMSKGYTCTLWFNVEKISRKDKIMLLKMGSKKFCVYLYFNTDRRVSVQLKYQGVKFEEKSFSFVKFKYESWNFLCVSHDLDVQNGIQSHVFTLYVNGEKLQTLNQEINIQEKSFLNIFKTYFKSYGNFSLEDVYLGKVTKNRVVIGMEKKNRFKDNENQNQNQNENDDEEEEEGERNEYEEEDEEDTMKFENDFTSFSIGNFVLIEDKITEKESFLMYNLGPNYTGDFDEDITAYFPNNIINRKSVKKFPDIYGIKYSNTGFHLTHLSNRILFVFCCRDATLATRLNIHIVSNIQESRRRKKVQRTFQIRPPKDDENVPDLQHVYQQKDREDPLHISLNIPEFTPVQASIVGKIRMVRRFLFKTNLFVLGGMREILNFVPTFERHLRMKILDLIYYLMRGNADNSREMKQVDGYRLLNYIMQQDFFDIGEDLMLMILKLCGFEIHLSSERPVLKTNNIESFSFLENGIISNRKPLMELLLDYHIWIKGSYDLQRKLYKTILYMIGTHSNKKYHKSIFRKLGVADQILFNLSEIHLHMKPYNNIVISFMVQLIRRILVTPIQMKFFGVLKNYLFLTHPKSHNEKISVFARERIMKLLYEKIIGDSITKDHVIDVLSMMPIYSIYMLLNVPSSTVRSTWLDILSFYISFPSVEEKYYNKSMIQKIARQLSKHRVGKSEISSLFNLFIGKRDILIKKDIYDIYPKLRVQFEDFLLVIMKIIPAMVTEELRYNTFEVLYNIFQHGDVKFQKLFVVKDIHIYLQDFLSKNILKENKKLLKLIIDFLTSYLLYIMMHEKKGMVSIEIILKNFYFINGYNYEFFKRVERSIIAKIFNHFLESFLLKDGELPRKWDVIFTRFCSIVVNIITLFNIPIEKDKTDISLFKFKEYSGSELHKMKPKLLEWYENKMKDLKMDCYPSYYKGSMFYQNSLVFWILECLRIGLEKINVSKNVTQSMFFAITGKSEYMIINTLKKLILYVLSTKSEAYQLCGLLNLLNLKDHSKALLLEEFMNDKKFTFQLVYRVSQLLEDENDNKSAKYLLLEEIRGIILKKKKIYFNKLIVKMTNINNSEFNDLLTNVYKWENQEKKEKHIEMVKIKERYDKKMRLLNEIIEHSDKELAEMKIKVFSKKDKVINNFKLKESQYYYQEEQIRVLWKTRMKRFFMNERNILCSFNFKITQNNSHNYKQHEVRVYKGGIYSSKDPDCLLPWKLDNTTGQNRVRTRIRRCYKRFVDLKFCRRKDILFNIIPTDKVTLSVQCKRIAPSITYTGMMYLLSKTFIYRGKESVRDDVIVNDIRDKMMLMKYHNVEEVHKRRYMLQDNALEIFFVDGKSYFFAFPSERKRDATFKLLYNFKRCPNLKKYHTAKLQQKWKNWEISNFEYLLHLNTLSGRSFNDLTQYPVFPYIISNYKDTNLDLTKPQNFRDLSKPMGALNEKRLMKAKEKYECLKMSYSPKSSSPEQKPFFWGTHYLAPMASVLFYLIRLEPFTNIFFCMNDEKIDEPGRSFFSIKQCWESSSGENNIGTSDVRELIPEFFYLPEMLQNRNRVKWNLFMDKYIVDDVELPIWSNTALEFIRKHREALECSYVSKNLHNWIDLIFGCKQRGEEAEKAYNVFHHYCYEGSFEHTRDKVELEAMKTMVLNHGQVPKQIFHKKHCIRNDFIINVNEIKVKSAKKLKTHTVNIFRETIGDIHIYDDNNTICVGLYKILLPKTKLNKEVSLSTQSEHSDKKSTDMRYLCYEHEWNLSMKVCEWNTGKDVYSFFNGSRLDYYTCAMFSSDGSILVVGSDLSAIHLYEMDTERRIILKKLITLYGHSDAVTCVYISNLFNLCISGSNDCTAIFWDITKFSYIISIRFHFPVINICVNSQSGDVAILTNDNTLHLYTSNGELIIKKKFHYQITALCFSHYKMGVEKNLLFVGYKNGTLDILDAFYFKKITKLHPSKEINAEITHITLNNDQTTLAITDVQGIAVTLKVDVN